MRVLVIDDNPAIAAFIRSLLPEADVQAALSGMVAFDMIRQMRVRQETFDLIVLDIKMPELNGYETCAQVRVLSPKTPIVPFASVLDDTPDLYWKELGYAPLIRKGMNPEFVREQLLEAYRMQPIVYQSAALLQLQKSVSAKELQLRQNNALQVIVIATKLIDRLGLIAFIESIPLQASITVSTPEVARTALSHITQGVIIVPVSDSQHGLMLSLESELPVMIVANTTAEAHSLHIHSMRTGSAIGIVVADERAVDILEEGIRTLLTGTFYIDPRVERTSRSSSAILVSLLRQEVGEQEFSQRDIEFLLLEAQDIPSEEVAERLKVTVNAVYKLRSRLSQRLNMTPAQLRRFARRITEKIE